MKKVFSQLTIMTILLNACNTIDSREVTVSEYLDRIETEISKILRQNGVFDSENEIKSEFLNSINGEVSLNKAGIDAMIEARIKAQEVHSYLNNYWNYVNHIKYDDDVYACYFHISGFDDLHYAVYKFKDKFWNKPDRIAYEIKNPLSEHLIVNQNEYKSKGYKMIILNYDEGPANHENLKLRVKDNLLVFERGNLMHSLYDLKNDKLLINEINPWYKAKQETEQKVDIGVLKDWIKTQIHQKIETELNKNASR